MVDKELAEYIKGVVSTYCGIAVQSIGEFIVEHDNQINSRTREEFNKRKPRSPIDIYNDYCKKLGILKDENGRE